MTTIKDVAKLAEVSVATVSRYLNGNGYVSTEAKSAIEQAIQTLGYKPNQIARSLSKKQMHTIGLIVPDITNPFFTELARAIEDTALKAGYTVVLCNSDEQASKEQQYIDTLQQTYIAGFIIATNQLLSETYKNLNRPVVLLDRTAEAGLPTVSTQNDYGAELATQHMIDCGAKQLAFFGGPKELMPVQQRLAGFEKVIATQQMRSLTFESAFHFVEAEQLALKVLTEQPAIDGIFASNDTIAIGVMKAAHKLGRKIPESLQLVGFDGIKLGEMMTPELTTVAQNIYELGEVATQMVIQQIKGESLPQQHVSIAPKLIVRQTTKELT